MAAIKDRDTSKSFRRKICELQRVSLSFMGCQDLSYFFLKVTTFSFI